MSTVADSRESKFIPRPGSPSGQVELASNGRVGTIRIILKSVNRHCRSSASLPDGTVLVGASRQPFLDAARVLIAAGYDPENWLEGWRPGATAFELRARLGIAAGLTVDETRTIFAPWKPFSPSAVCSSIRYPGETATIPASASSPFPAAPPEQQSKTAEPELHAVRAAPRVRARKRAARGTCRSNDPAIHPDRGGK
jgi:hypothetical protein